ncbi:MAG: PP2C family protein-serine/threonine phosphatase [Pseudonocardiaceae bacterium]
MASDLDPVAELLVPGLPRLLDNIAQAVIVQDESGRIQLLNVAARRLFPDLHLGGDFERSGESFVAESGGRRVNGRLRRLADGWHAWVVSDQDFILEASRELASGEGHDAAVALLQLAVPVVGEQAAVLLPASRARMSWWCFADGAPEPTAGVARAPAPRTAPVLAGALRGAMADAITLPVEELPALAAVLGPDVAERAPVVAAPLRGPDQVEGLLIVVRPTADTLLAQLAGLAGPAMGASRRRREQARALTLLQAPLLPLRPGALPELPGVQFGVAYQAAGELAVGGDFYLIRPTPDGGALFGLGDVCGKGAEALAESGRVQHSLAALMIIEQDPTRLLYLLNRALLAAGRTVFTTMVLGALQPTPAGCRLTLATGGHPAPMVLRPSGHVTDVGLLGTVVGILPDARFGRTSITLAPGETCLMYSDGVTEAGRGFGDDQEQFGPARLAACLRDCAGMTAQAVATRVERTVHGWLGRNDGDDLAVLAVRASELSLDAPGDGPR